MCSLPPLSLSLLRSLSLVVLTAPEAAAQTHASCLFDVSTLRGQVRDCLPVSPAPAQPFAKWKAERKDA